MSFLDYQISDVHLTTLLTNVVTALVVLYYGRRSALTLRQLAAYVGGVMVIAVESYEFIWLGLGSLVITHKLGVSFALLNLAILVVSGIAVIGVWKVLRIDRIFLVLFVATVILWWIWIPTFASTAGSREYADTIKVFQNAVVAYGFSGRK